MKISNLTTNQLNQNGYNKNSQTRDKIGALYTFPIDYTPHDCLSCEGFVLKIVDYTITMNRTDKSGNDTDCVWSYGENRNGAAKVTSSAPSNAIYGKSSTVQPPSQVVHICIKYK